MTKHTVSLSSMRWLLFLLSITKIPLIFYVRPRLMLLNDQEVKVRIRLRRRTKNHLNSMYFGALAVGADVAGGIHAFYFAKRYGWKIGFAFKGMEAKFLKRAESHTTFHCADGKAIEKAVLESAERKERVNTPVTVNALNEAGEVVASFTMEISVKVV